MIKDFLNSNCFVYEENVDLKKKTWIHRGGYASFFITPESIEKLEKLVLYLFELKKKFEIIGHTSNLYFLNSYNPEIVIATNKCNNFEIKNDEIVCDCGTKVSSLAKLCVGQGILGFEYLTALPGTIGGSIYNNSSCKTNSIAELIDIVELLEKDGKKHYLTKEELKFEFRSSILKRQEIEGILTRAFLKIKTTEDISRLREISNNNESERKRLLEANRNTLGCTFDSPFVNGKMPLIYLILNKFHLVLMKILGFRGTKLKHKQKVFLLTISGYRYLTPYVSDKLMITYIWRDEKADEFFPKYVEFMKKVYKTDKIEIEIKS